jgi:serine/threonine protein kinase
MDVEYPEAQPPLPKSPAEIGAAVPLGAAPSQSATLPPPPGQSGATAGPHIPDHQLLKKIGGGSYGEVWLARSVVGTLRAVKIVSRRDFSEAYPFEREFKGIQKYEPVSRSHEGLIDILQIGRNEEAGYFYYVMELADDSNAECGVRNAECASASSAIPHSAFRDPHSYAPRTLRSDQKARGPLPLAECVEIGLSLGSALEHLHRSGLVHRDIKPSNIIFVQGAPKLADIGLVADVEEARSFVGTIGFIPPEGPGSAQADVYSLGKVLYEMLTGKDRQEFPALPEAFRESADPRLREFNQVILRACEGDPRLRYPSAQAMHDDLARVAEGKSARGARAPQRRWAMLKSLGLAAGALGLLLASPWLVKVLKPEKPPDPEAQRLYSQGQFLLSRLTDESVDKAISNLNQAIKIDPQFVPAYISLFEIYCWNPGGISDREQSQKVKEIAQKLLSFDPNLGEGHAALAMSKFDEGDWQGAEQEIQQAIRLKPKYSLGHGIYGFICALEGRTREAHRELEEAQRLDPISRIQATVAGFAFLAERDYDGALAQFRKAILLDPNFPLAHMWIGVTLEAKGNYLDAIAEYERFDLSAGEERAKVAQDYQVLRQAFRENGEKGYWGRALDLALAKKTLKDQTLFANELWELAGIYAQLGQKAKALDLLEKDLAAGELTVWLRVKPCFESLRGEPRFQALLQKLGHKY